MKTKKLSVIAHGGAGSSNEHSDGTEKAVQSCYEANQNNADLLHSVAQSSSYFRRRWTLQRRKRIPCA